MTGIIIHTPHIPPSVNHCYANLKGRGRQKTVRYREWENAAGWDFKRKGEVIGPFVCTITIDRSKRHHASDIDNRIKPTMDMLQTFGIVQNDKLCESVTCRWGDADGGMIVHVSPWSGNAASFTPLEKTAEPAQ